MLLAVTVAALATAAPAEAQECAGRAILLFRTAVYSEEPTPADLPANPGAPLAFGRLGFLPGPEGTANCDPRSVQVSEVEGLPPDLAVTVENRAGFVFILGALCAGFEDEERAACILRPLQFEDRLYTAARYPNGAEPRFRTGEALGAGELDGEQVSALSLEGVDPAVAVGLEGHPEDAFVAEGACPYERFAAEQREDDLLRCLQAPLWFVFELTSPPAATVGDQVTARADRAVSAGGRRGDGVARSAQHPRRPRPSRHDRMPWRSGRSRSDRRERSACRSRCRTFPKGSTRPS